MCPLSLKETSQKTHTCLPLQLNRNNGGWEVGSFHLSSVITGGIWLKQLPCRGKKAGHCRQRERVQQNRDVLESSVQTNSVNQMH